MKEFKNKAGERVEVTIQKLRACLQRAIGRFNDNEKSSLLLPRETPNGLYVGEKDKGWGAASERAIAHRLAVYLECGLRSEGIVEDGGLISVDCEYNRHLDGMKTHRIPEELIIIVEKAKRNPKPISDDEGFYVFSIAPDIIVHHRGEDDLNLLVIELKKTTNHEIPKYDDLKLRCFTKEGRDAYAYQLGFAVVAVDDVAPAERELKLSTLYANGRPQPENYGA